MKMNRLLTLTTILIFSSMSYSQEEEKTDNKLVFAVVQLKGDSLNENDSDFYDGGPSVAVNFPFWMLSDSIQWPTQNDFPLDLSSEGLRKVPKSLERSSYYPKIDLSNNKIKKLTAKNLWVLTDSLDLSNNDLKTITKIHDWQTLRLFTFFRNPGLDRLDYLDISHNNLEGNVKVSFQFPALSYVDASHNKLNKLRFDYRRNELRHADFSNNEIEEIVIIQPKSFSSLTYLNLSENNLQRIPSSMRYFKSLEKLDLSNNELKKFTLSLRNMTNLEVLDLSGNPISEEDIERIRGRNPKVEIVF